VNGVDLDLQLFQGMIHDSVKYCDMHNEPLQFQYTNGKHGVRLIKLSMSKGKDGRVTLIRFDLAYCRVGSLSGQAIICSSVEKRGCNPRVQMNK
jgi:hypothetical protein